MVRLIGMMSAVLALALAGCGGTPVRVPAGEGVELAATPFFPQRAHECGPAALAMVLADSGVEVTADELTDRVYLPGRRGSLQLELVAAARGFDRLAYVIAPRLEALFGQLQAGRPVLVMQNLAFRRFPAWHYAVAIGFDARRQVVILRSGTHERLQMPVEKFARSWALAEHWGLIVLEPGESASGLEAGRYVQAAAGLEAAGRHAVALQAYRTALAQWPREPTAALGVGNALYRLGDLAGAERAYRDLIVWHPRHAVGRHNLAQVLLARGDPVAALREIEAARAVLEDTRFATQLDRTEARIRETLNEAR